MTEPKPPRRYRTFRIRDALIIGLLVYIAALMTGSAILQDLFRNEMRSVHRLQGSAVAGQQASGPT